MDYKRIKVGDEAKILIGPLKGETCKVVEIEFHPAVRNGWFTVELGNNQGQGLFTGDELRFLGE